MSDKREKYLQDTNKDDANLLQKIWSVGIGRFFLLTMLFILVMLINILLAWNDAAKFLLISGIEFLFLFIAGWLYFFFLQKSI